MSTPTTLTGDERIGVAFIVEAAAFSAASSGFLLLYLLILRTSRAFKSGRRTSAFFRNHLNYYLLSLLVADVIQGAGGVMSAKWVSTSQVSDGTFCVVQGALKQVGDVAVAMSILAITAHTFLVIFFHWTPPQSNALPMVVLAAIWVFVGLISSLGFILNRHSTYYGVTGLWCWITAEFPTQRITLEYLWLWVAAVANIVLYIPLSLALRGNIIVDGWKVSWRSTSSHPWGGPQKYNVRVARLMLVYPLIYLITVLPESVVRFLAFAGYSVPFQATVFSSILFASSGIFNVALFTTTRPTLLGNSMSNDEFHSKDATMSLKKVISSPHALAPKYPPRILTGAHVHGAFELQVMSPPRSEEIEDGWYQTPTSAIRFGEKRPR